MCRATVRKTRTACVQKFGGAAQAPPKNGRHVRIGSGKSNFKRTGSLRRPENESYRRDYIRGQNRFPPPRFDFLSGGKAFFDYGEEARGTLK